MLARPFLWKKLDFLETYAIVETLRNDGTINFATMKYFLLLFFALQTTQTYAQSSCSSDKTAAIKTMYERFTNADCEVCWTKPLATAKFGVTLDWLAPSPAGDDAPLSAAANRDALFRLESLKITLPKEQQVVKTEVKTEVKKSAYQIRVAHGLAVAGYIGASIELTQFPSNLRNAKNLTAVLLLTETIPKGMADTPIERLLVRNMLIEPWKMTMASSPKNSKPDDKQVLLTRRPLSIPSGVNPDNLHVMGWVQDDSGRILAAAQSLCIEPKE